MILDGLTRFGTNCHRKQFVVPEEADALQDECEKKGVEYKRTDGRIMSRFVATGEKDLPIAEVDFLGNTVTPYKFR